MKFTIHRRLTQHNAFREVIQTGKRRRAEGVDFYFKNNTLCYPRLGVSVPKRAFKLAWIRNRIKRIIRESFREKQSSLCDKSGNFYDVVVIVSHCFKAHTETEQRKCLDSYWEQLIA